jgi:sulfatase maturation enzyme AslB (radical SAM superfamily)
MTEHNDMLKEAIRLLEEWDERETQLAIMFCGSEPPVEKGSFVERLRKIVTAYKEKNP